MPDKLADWIMDGPITPPTRSGDQAAYEHELVPPFETSLPTDGNDVIGTDDDPWMVGSSE
jgi:hypothetical protein